MAHNNYPVNAAWLAKKTEIDEWLKSCDKARRSRVAYLQSAHASGKSTTFLKYLMEQGYPDGAPVFVYVVPNNTELDIVAHYLNTSPLEGNVDFTCNLFDGTAAWNIMTYDYYVEWDRRCGQDGYPSRITVMADVELRASVACEIFFALLLDRARLTREKPSVVANILLVSAHRSQSTISAFRRLVDDVSEIDVPDITPELTYEMYEDEDFEDFVGQVAADCLEEDQEARVVVVAHRANDLLRRALPETRHSWIPPHLVDRATDNLRDHVIAVDAETELSAPVSNLRVLALDCRLDTMVIDVATGHLVKTKRQMDSAEVDRALSWALRTENPEDVRVITNLTPAMPPSDEGSSPAWNQDLPELVMMLMRSFPDRALMDIPIRQPRHTDVLDDTLLQLEDSGLVTADATGKIWSTTDIGSGALEIMAFTRTPSDLFSPVNIYVANLISRARAEPDEKVGRVLLRMAAIADVRIEAFCVSREQRDAVPLRQIREQCAGVGRKQCWRGGLWTALGVYLAFREREDLGGPVVDEVDRGPLTIRPSRVQWIAAMAASLEQMLGLSPAVREINDTLLDNDQVAAVEDHLVRVWFHKAIAIKWNDRLFTDAASHKSVKVDTSTELLDVEGQKRRALDQNQGGFFAIYSTLWYDQEILNASGLTYVSSRSLAGLESEAGTSWADLVRMGPMRSGRTAARGQV